MPDISLSARHESLLKQKLQHLFWRLIAVLPDRPYLRWKYYSMAGRFPDLERPRLFSEKVQARKLYDRRPIYAQMVDKHGAKALIAERAGAQYVIPTYWVGFSPSQYTDEAKRAPGRRSGPGVAEAEASPHQPRMGLWRVRAADHHRRDAGGERRCAGRLPLLRLLRPRLPYRDAVEAGRQGL